MEDDNNEHSASHLGTQVAVAEDDDLGTGVSVIDLDNTLFNELQVAQESSTKRRLQLTIICEEALSQRWSEIIKFLKQEGNPAGNATMAHALISQIIMGGDPQRFDDITNTTGKPVTHKELWSVVLSILKKRNLVFDRGYVSGIKVIEK